MRIRIKLLIIAALLQVILSQMACKLSNHERHAASPERTPRSSYLKKDDYDKDGFNRSTHIHRDTGTLYNLDGFDYEGYDKKGFHRDTHFHRDTRTPYNLDGFDFDGYNQDGFHQTTHTHRNGTQYNPDGLDYAGYNQDGFHQTTHLYRNGTHYNPDGFDYQGYNQDGFHQITHLYRNTLRLFNPEGFDYQGYDRNGFHQTTHIHRNGTQYNAAGFDYQGYNSDGFHLNTHFHRNGTRYNPAGFDYQGYNSDGFHQITHLHRNDTQYSPAGFDYQGYDRNGFHQITHRHRNGTPYNPAGFDYQGYNSDGFHQTTHLHRNGTQYSPAGFDFKGYDIDGFHKFTHLHRNGTPYNPAGFDFEGYNSDGFHQITHLHRNGTPYNPAGFDFEGYNSDGFHQITHLHRNGTFYNPDGFDYQGNDDQGYSREGFHRDTHFHRETGNLYSPAGFDYQGYNEKGFHRDTHKHKDTNDLYGPAGYDYKGYDRNGVDENGFNKLGVDVSGLDTNRANAFREEKVKERLERLGRLGFVFQDVIVLDNITTLSEIKDALENLRLGGTYAPTPSDKDIYNSLKKLEDTINAWNDAAYMYDDIENLQHVNAMVRKQGQYLDYEKLWRDTEKDIPHPKDAFYEKIYNSLKDDDLVKDATFPDDADAPLNAPNEWNTLQKKDYLIIALASIKNPETPPILTNTIRTFVVHEFYPTKGNSPLWFATQRLKLYKFSEVVDDLNKEDKKSAISQLLHAGKHCSDAKYDIYNSLLALFNNPAYNELQQREDALAATLQQKMEMVATKEKAEVLQSAVNTVFNKVTGPEDRTDLINIGYSERTADKVRQESFTFKGSTWDYYAPTLGLKLRGTYYPSMRLTIDENDLFDIGAYTPKRLFDAIKRTLGRDIIEKYGNGLFPLLSGTLGDKLIRGALMEKGFLENSPH